MTYNDLLANFRKYQMIFYSKEKSSEVVYFLVWGIFTFNTVLILFSKDSEKLKRLIGSLWLVEIVFFVIVASYTYYSIKSHDKFICKKFGLPDSSTRENRDLSILKSIFVSSGTTTDKISHYKRRAEYEISTLREKIKFMGFTGLGLSFILKSNIAAFLKEPNQFRAVISTVVLLFLPSLAIKIFLYSRVFHNIDRKMYILLTEIENSLYVTPITTR